MKIIFIIFILISFSFNISANEDNSLIRKKNFQIQAIVYSSLGTGLSLSYRFKKNIWLNFDTQSLSGTMSIDSNDGLTREDADYEFQTNYINVRNYLTHIINNLFVQEFINTRLPVFEDSYRASNTLVLLSPSSAG